VSALTSAAPTTRAPSFILRSALNHRLMSSAPVSSSNHQSPAAPTAAGPTNVPAAPVLRGSCECGSVGFEGQGPSAINFVCHCSVCRAATGLPYTAAAGFKAENVLWINEENMEKRLPPNSKNTRYYCKSCGRYRMRSWNNRAQCADCAPSRVAAMLVKTPRVLSASTPCRCTASSQGRWTTCTSPITTYSTHIVHTTCRMPSPNGRPCLRERW